METTITLTPRELTIFIRRAWLEGFSLADPALVVRDEEKAMATTYARNAVTRQLGLQVPYSNELNGPLV